MTKDDIIRIGIDAGLLNYIDNEAPRRYFIDGNADLSEVQKFAALVVTYMTRLGYRKCAEGQRTTQHCGLLETAVAAEREACAKVCEAQQDIFLSPRYAANQPMSSIAERFAAGQCAAAIRARGET